MNELRVIWKEEFPPALLEIPEPPEKLYIRGRDFDTEAIYLAVVGSRKYTNYGKEAVRKIISGLAGHNIVIVSGLAIGIDAIAHRAALDAGLRTLAVPGSGLDDKVLYPASNRNLAKEIIDKGGTLVSEFEPDFHATVWSFPQRNRIMAGISKAVLVVEAESKSGTLITSRLATDYNRDVFAVPGSIFSPTSDGPHMLIKLGAVPITSAQDLLSALGLKDHSPTNTKNLFDSLSEEERLIADHLREPLSRDEIISRTGKPVREINSLLSSMELKGLIAEEVGQIRLIQ